jgi:16S rRNA A1518/A1519 N6-dimethyltransferase RsmA/KsgA/DIM1 with predicted DNA glycosylase/AP lyase activity
MRTMFSHRKTEQFWKQNTIYLFSKFSGNIEGKIAIEVGPGPGGITRAILDTKIRECHVIEKDPRFLPSLNLIKNAVGPEKLHISIGDCLHYNITGKSEFYF